MSPSNCFDEQCVSECADGGSNCYCKTSGQEITAADVCNTNDTFDGLSSSTYCDDASGTCKAHCASSDGTTVITGDSCFCGVDLKCKEGQFCLRSPGAEVGVCLGSKLTGQCYEKGELNEKRFLGKIAVLESCWCGGMPCAIHSYCQSAVGFCSPGPKIQECTEDKAVSNPCQCWDVVARKTEMCQPSSETDTLARTYADVPECDSELSGTDFCQCGSGDFCSKEKCTLEDNKLESECSP